MIRLRNLAPEDRARLNVRPYPSRPEYVLLDPPGTTPSGYFRGTSDAYLEIPEAEAWQRFLAECYLPPSERRLLLLQPCSWAKPYDMSATLQQGLRLWLSDPKAAGEYWWVVAKSLKDPTVYENYILKLDDRARAAGFTDGLSDLISNDLRYTGGFATAPEFTMPKSVVDKVSGLGPAGKVVGSKLRGSFSSTRPSKASTVAATSMPRSPRATRSRSYSRPPHGGSSTSASAARSRTTAAAGRRSG